MLLLILRAMGGKQGPPLWVRYCSFQYPSFLLSSNTELCVLILEMYGVVL
jgi:hypothetical protein